MSELKLDTPLDIHEIDFRIQSINKGGYATILAYKDARVDINRLNAVCGKFGWERRHSRDNRNCTVSLWDEENKHWVSKEDTGTESNTEQQKGLASDSFKRACFNWGIGIELYDYPVIQIKLNSDEWETTAQGKIKQTWNLKLRDWVWYSEFTDGKLTFIAAKDNHGKIRFKHGVRKDREAVKVSEEHMPQMSSDPVNDDKIKRAVELFKTKIDEDDIDLNHGIMKKEDARLTNDEKSAVAKLLSDLGKAPGSNKKYTTLLREYMSYHPADNQEEK